MSLLRKLLRAARKYMGWGWRVVPVPPKQKGPRLKECVKNVKIDAKNNGVQVSYDPGKTTPQKIVAAFNKENPDTLLQSSGAKEAK